MKETNNPMKVDEDAMFQCGPCDVPENEIGGIGGGFIGLIQGETKGNEEDEAYARLELVAEMSNEYFPPLDGTALFSIGCSMNHSCRPNVSPVWNPKSDVPIETRVLVDLYGDSDEPSVGHREVFFDIEVEVKDGFPEPKRADNKITAIALYDKVVDEYYCFISDGLRDKGRFK